MHSAFSVEDKSDGGVGKDRQRGKDRFLPVQDRVAVHLIGGAGPVTGFLDNVVFDGKDRLLSLLLRTDPDPNSNDTVIPWHAVAYIDVEANVDADILGSIG